MRVRARRREDGWEEPYEIDGWPYRSDMLYISPTYGELPSPYTVLEPVLDPPARA